MLRNPKLAAAAALAVLSLPGIDAPAHAQSAVALSGQVTSAEEGAMEGVIVSAKREGSNITVSVVTDAQGHYGFPADRLGAGHYAL